MSTWALWLVSMFIILSWCLDFLFNHVRMTLITKLYPKIQQTICLAVSLFFRDFSTSRRSLWSLTGINDFKCSGTLADFNVSAPRCLLKSSCSICVLILTCSLVSAMCSRSSVSSSVGRNATQKHNELLILSLRYESSGRSSGGNAGQGFGLHARRLSRPHLSHLFWTNRHLYETKLGKCLFVWLVSLRHISTVWLLVP